MAMKTKGGSAALKREHQPGAPKLTSIGQGQHSRTTAAWEKENRWARTRLTMAKGKASLRAGLPLYHACFR
jgi:hypothetical protein